MVFFANYTIGRYGTVTGQEPAEGLLRNMTLREACLLRVRRLAKPHECTIDRGIEHQLQVRLEARQT